MRRELEPSMLNGDAHHSLTWEVELRIGRCRVFKDSNALRIAECLSFEHPFSVYASRAFKQPFLVNQAISVAIHWRRPAANEFAPAAVHEA